MTTASIFAGTFEDTETKRLFTGLQVTDLDTKEKSPVYEVTRVEVEPNPKRQWAFGADKIYLAVIDLGNEPFDKSHVETLDRIHSETGWLYEGKIVAGSAAYGALKLAQERGIRVCLPYGVFLPHKNRKPQIQS